MLTTSLPRKFFGSTRNGETGVVNVWLLRPDIDHSTVGKDSVLRKQFFPHVGTKNLCVTLRELSMFDGDTFSKFINCVMSSFSLNAYSIYF